MDSRQDNPVQNNSEKREDLKEKDQVNLTQDNEDVSLSELIKKLKKQEEMVLDHQETLKNFRNRIRLLEEQLATVITNVSKLM